MIGNINELLDKFCQKDIHSLKAKINEKLDGSDVTYDDTKKEFKLGDAIIAEVIEFDLNDNKAYYGIYNFNTKEKDFTIYTKGDESQLV